MEKSKNDFKAALVDKRLCNKQWDAELARRCLTVIVFRVASHECETMSPPLFLGGIIMINTTRLRCTIGWLGTLLPWLVVLLLGYFPASISETYYTYEAGPVFLMVLGSASFLLFSYKGYERVDDIINSIAGLFGVLICLFPCEWHYQFVGTFQVPMLTSMYIHYIAAIGFFSLLACNSLFLFTKTGGNMTRNKKIRNVIYRVCGIGMIGAFCILLLPVFHTRVWLIEAIALFFFGISFLTKANYYPWLFADKK